MSQNKTPEELLNDFNNLEAPKEINTVNTASEMASNFVKFIIRCSIKPGNDPFKTIFLYRLFKTIYKDDMTRKQFNRRLGEYVLVKSDIGFCYIDLQKYEGLSPNQFNEGRDKGQVNLLNNNRLLRCLDSFFTEFNIKKGNHPVPTILLFNAFRFWKRTKSVSCSKTAFFKLIKRNFEIKNTSLAHYVLLEFTDELRKIIKEDEIEGYIKGRKQDANKKRRKRTSKRYAIKQAQAGKIPGFEPKVQFKDPTGTT